MKGGIMYDQRDIVLLPFPYSDLTGAKQRPALIISNNTLNKTKDRICCPITSKQPTDGRGVRLDKRNFERGDLPFQSWVKPYRLFTIHEGAIKKRLCVVTKDLQSKIVESINNYLKIEKNPSSSIVKALYVTYNSL